jgi:parvulin-like peptidyl-prolyl isomerase
LATDAGAPGPDDAGVLAVTEGFETFPDGGKVPPLPDSRPNQVSFGVVQFSYKGAQFAPGEARTKAQALEKASSTLELAKRDFAAAVAKGDHGSTADAGKIPRGVLEPPIEYLLFMLDKGTVLSEPVDTPRGYWILRRND